MTELEAVNRALLLLGVAKIDSLDVQNQAARVMKALLEDTKRNVLCDFPWSFAFHRDELRAVIGERFEATDSGRLYPVYQYPPAAVNIHGVYGACDRKRALPYFRKDVERLIVMVPLRPSDHAPGLYVEYTAWVPDVLLWNADAVEALAARLASDAAAALTGNQELAGAMLQKYQILLGTAAHGSNMEEYSMFSPFDDYSRVRSWP